jgi:hypothetical protein
MEITIPVEYFEKHKLEMKKAFKEKYNSEQNAEYLITIEDPQVSTDADGDRVWISCTDEESGINANFDVMKENVMVSLIEYSVKKLNKMKSMLETLL